MLPKCIEARLAGRPPFGYDRWRGGTRTTMRTIIAVLFLALASTGLADEEFPGCSVWLSGTAFSDQGILMFRLDQTVEGNVTGNVVLLFPNREVAKEFMPMYGLLARKPLRLKARGVLLAVPGERAVCTPNVEFILDGLEPARPPPAPLLTSR